jgi:hypothetical protein
VESLILSMDKPDPAPNVQWLKEAENRLAAYQSGALDAVDAVQVFIDLDKPI